MSACSKTSQANSCDSSTRSWLKTFELGHVSRSVVSQYTHPWTCAYEEGRAEFRRQFSSLPVAWRSWTIEARQVAQRRAPLPLFRGVIARAAAINMMARRPELLAIWECYALLKLVIMLSYILLIALPSAFFLYVCSSIGKRRRHMPDGR